MRRAALSANALELPATLPVTLEIVRGRQTVARRGLFFAVIAKHRRAVYQQLNGETILADECKCIVNWPDEGGDFGLSFDILRNADCPIDEHQRLTLREMQLETEGD
jgi:hypothetical protein